MATAATKKFRNIDEYIYTLREDQVKRLQEMRRLIVQIAPEAVEVISYNMPAYKVYGRILVYLAAHKEHLGFYPANARIIELFRDDLRDYYTSKGTIRFEYKKAIPVDLIRKIIEYRVNENRLKRK